jgi:hypothetical protein
MVCHLIFSTYVTEPDGEISSHFAQREDFGVPVLGTVLVFGVKRDFNQGLIIFVQQRGFNLSVAEVR